MSIIRIFDYIWVEIAYGLEKIVLLPRTWSVRFFAKKIPCLVASIVKQIQDMIIEGNWPRFAKLTLIKKISALFMEIFDPEGRANFDFCKLKDICLKT